MMDDPDIGGLIELYFQRLGNKIDSNEDINNRKSTSSAAGSDARRKGSRSSTRKPRTGKGNASVKTKSSTQNNKASRTSRQSNPRSSAKTKVTAKSKGTKKTNSASSVKKPVSVSNIKSPHLKLLTRLKNVANKTARNPKGEKSVKSLSDLVTTAERLDKAGLLSKNKTLIMTSIGKIKEFIKDRDPKEMLTVKLSKETMEAISKAEKEKSPVAQVNFLDGVGK